MFSSAIRPTLSLSSSKQINIRTIHNFLNVLLTTLIVAIISEYVHTSYGACDRLDRDSLISFNQSIISTASPLNWSLSIDCCSWEGVACDSSAKVTNLSLPSRGLAGSIPLSILNLSSLTDLSLSHNQLSGPLPPSFFMSLNGLRVIDLSLNRLSGDLTLSEILPPTIQIFNFSSNQFRGPIQYSFLEPATILQTFDISNNSFNGSIPSFICSFSPSIQQIDISGNSFMGLIPQGFGQCRNLKSLRAGFFNYLSGEIPQDIYGLRNLQELYLPGCNLSGQIPERIVNLSSLRILNLFGNALTGVIPRDIGRLSELEELQLHINQLNGTIPPSLTNCTNLTILNLRVNLLGGNLSAFDFSKFVQLRSLDLGRNNFQGGLPESIFSCKNLTAVRLAGNNLTGQILPGIASLQSLSFLSLSSNYFRNLTSTIRILAGCKNLSTLIFSLNFHGETLPGDENLIGPDDFRNLRILFLDTCEFNGEIPRWLPKLQQLEAIDLSHNNITGSIPPTLGDFPNLFYLDFSHNLISGPFPIDLIRLRRLGFKTDSDSADRSYLELPVFAQPTNFSSLQYNQIFYLPRAVFLGNNSLTGNIPLEIGQLKSITALDLKHNNFSGKIPNSISNLTNLETLDLSGNHLTGGIPASLTGLNFLSKFSVAYNDLEGPIPTGGQFGTFPNTSFEGNPRLCGGLWRSPCDSRTGEVPKEDEEDNEDEEGAIINWVGFVIGFVVSFILAEIVAFKVFKLHKPKPGTPRGRR